jgi:plasmid maintenance system killer protein
MAINDDDFIHKGLKNFWVSNQVDKSGINSAHARVISGNLVHLDTARNMHDLKTGWGEIKHFKPLTGHKNRFELEVNGNWRVTFDAVVSGADISISKIDLEDVHVKGGAKKH